MKKEFYIFDLDGTLVDSPQYWQALERDYLEAKGLSQEEIASVLPVIQPMTTLEAAGYCIQQFGFAGTPQSIAGEINDMIAYHYQNSVRLKPGVQAFLQARKAEGAKLCIASATAKPLVQLCMDALQLHSYFEFFISCEEVGASKDKPDVFLEAVRRLGGTPQQAAVFEDSLVAATTAKQAGFFTVGVYDPYCRENWEAMQTVADQLITDWRNAP